MTEVQKIEKPKKVHDHKAYMKVYMAKSDHYRCDCGGMFRTYSKHTHNKSTRHLQYIADNPNPKYFKFKLVELGAGVVKPEPIPEEVATVHKSVGPKLIECSCGGSYDKSHSKRHLLTKKHMLYIKSKE